MKLAISIHHINNDFICQGKYWYAKYYKFGFVLPMLLTKLCVGERKVLPPLMHSCHPFILIYIYWILCLKKQLKKQKNRHPFTLIHMYWIFSLTNRGKYKKKTN
jgi:hypothetical protein